jgi:hypothetical protein
MLSNLPVTQLFLWPTGSDYLLSTEKWGGEPAAVALTPKGPWTYGALINLIWSFAGYDDRTDVNATFFQPFLSYTIPTAWSFSVNSESTHDWKNEHWRCRSIRMFRR